MILAIDPGREKCGIAVLDQQKRIIRHEVIARSSLVAVLESYCRQYGVSSLILGNGTGSKQVVQELKLLADLLNIEIVLVDEYKTTEQARKRYWQENPPKGWRKLIPLGLQVPPEPVDDYVAIIIGEKYQKK